MSFDCKIKLTKNLFSEKEKSLCENGRLKASLFRFESGVECVRIENARGYITVLPFKGQQIWRAEFDNHELIMRNTFEEPVNTDEFLKTYGAFLIHCGLTSIGNPSPEDTHPLHGELPNAHYKTAWLVCGEDEKGRFIEISGEFEYNIGFEVRYQFVPQLRLYENATTVAVTVNLNNLRGTEQEYLYLCHMNFRPVDGGRLVYSAKRENVYTHVLVPDNMPDDKKEKLEKYFAELEKDVSVHDIFDSASQFYEPEIVFTVKYESDENGRGYCMQMLSDGYADYVSHYPAQLPYGIRWIARNDDEDALGMLLPATGEHNGYLDCVKKGYVRHLPPYGSVSFNFDVGILAPDHAKALEEKIKKMI